MGNPGDRFAVAALSYRNASRFPGAIIFQLWEKKLHPLKKNLVESYGVQLYGIHVLPILRSPEQELRDFDAIVRDEDLSSSLLPKLRFLISDAALQKFPIVGGCNPIIFTININDGGPRWRAHALNPLYPNIDCNFDELSNVIADFVFDISFCNSFYNSKIIHMMLNSMKYQAEFFRKKAVFSGMGPGIPYVSFSSMARKNQVFGTKEHTENFIALWDGFLVQMLREIRLPEDFNNNIIWNFPDFRHQISPSAIEQVVSRLEPGVHILFVQRGSTNSGTTPKFKNEVDAVFSSLPILGRGGKRFGVFSGGAIPNAARALVSKKAAYAVRIYVGAR